MMRSKKHQEMLMIMNTSMKNGVQNNKKLKDRNILKNNLTKMRHGKAKSKLS